MIEFKPVKIQNSILNYFYNEQCFEDSGNYNDDETPTISYSELERELKYTRVELKPQMIDLRNEGYIMLVQQMNYDNQFSGRGWVLTDKGAELVKKLFFKPQETC